MIKKLWLFIKHYWYIPLVLVLLLCAFVVYRSKISALLGVISSAREEHKKSLHKLSHAADTKVKAERKATDKHIKEMTSIEVEKQKEIDKVLSKIERREDELKENIDEIAEQLRKEFGE
tara:strand:- start:502 stop:858 length:357 start_codon:yes stop_codon:yes gene_type:complete